MTTDEMIAFWSRLGGGTVHPEDDAALLMANRFETRTLPLPWTGPIKSARAFVGLWNPGLDPRDVPYEVSNATFRDDLRRTLQGNAPYVFFSNLGIKTMRGPSGQKENLAKTDLRSAGLGFASSSWSPTTASIAQPQERSSIAYKARPS
jgi:hypothetical protein